MGRVQSWAVRNVYFESHTVAVETDLFFQLRSKRYLSATTKRYSRRTKHLQSMVHTDRSPARRTCSAQSASWKGWRLASSDPVSSHAKVSSVFLSTIGEMGAIAKADPSGPDSANSSEDSQALTESEGKALGLQLREGQTGQRSWCDAETSEQSASEPLVRARVSDTVAAIDSVGQC